MHIQVKTLTGKTANISVNANTSIDELSVMVENVFSVPLDEQKLLFNGKKLAGGNVSDYGITDACAIHMVVSIEGGKKKKKKVQKKPKKQHRKKKVNLAILSYFKVEGDKVVRLRQKSPTGTFMAEHADRFYCGRSHITYKKKEDQAQSKQQEKAADKGADKAKAQAPAKDKKKK